MFEPPTETAFSSLLVLAAPAAHLGTVALTAYLPVGRRAEPDDARGAADVLAAMLASTRAFRPPPGALRAGPEPIVTGDDFTVTISLSGPVDQTDELIRELMWMLQGLPGGDSSAPVDRSWFEAAHRSAMSLAVQEFRSPDRLASAVLRHWSYRLDPFYGRPFQGRLKEIQQLTPESFTRFVTGVVRSRRLVLAVCAGRALSRAPLDDLAGQWTGIRQEEVTGPVPAADHDGRQFGAGAAGKAGAVQSIALSCPTVARHDPGYRPAALIAAVLSAPDGPLVPRLRHELGHLYMLRTEVVPGLSSGRVTAEAQVRAGTGGECLATIRGALKDLAVRPLSETYLSVVKTRQLIRIRRAVATNAGRAADVVSAHFHGLPNDHHRSIEPGIAAVTPGRLQEFANTLDQGRISTVIV